MKNEKQSSQTPGAVLNSNSTNAENKTVVKFEKGNDRYTSNSRKDYSEHKLTLNLPSRF